MTIKPTRLQVKKNVIGARVISYGGFGQGTGLTIAMDNVRCTSRESHLTSCPYLNSTAIRSCSHREDAGVICGPRKSISMISPIYILYILTFILLLFKTYQLLFILNFPTLPFIKIILYIFSKI